MVLPETTYWTRVAKRWKEIKWPKVCTHDSTLTSWPHPPFTIFGSHCTIQLERVLVGLPHSEYKYDVWDRRCRLNTPRRTTKFTPTSVHNLLTPRGHSKPDWGSAFITSTRLHPTAAMPASSSAAIYIVESLKISLDILKDVSGDLPPPLSSIVNLAMRVIAVIEVRPTVPHTPFGH